MTAIESNVPGFFFRISLTSSQHLEVEFLRGLTVKVAFPLKDMQTLHSGRATSFMDLYAHPMGFWYITHGCQKNPAPRRSSVEISNLAETELALGCRFLIL